uniref:ATP synthase complex subunit 8 n=1 Tax=Dolichovespula lama TaxID=2982221 RepID=A0A977SPK0_9HYME|nr:ATP synthase F0 subunit 8 [Dolichovespula lama]
MPQLSPMKWLFLFTSITLIFFLILIKLNFFFKKKMLSEKNINLNMMKNKKFKW